MAAQRGAEGALPGMILSLPGLQGHGTGMLWTPAYRGHFFPDEGMISGSRDACKRDSYVPDFAAHLGQHHSPIALSRRLRGAQLFRHRQGARAKLGCTL